MVMDIVKRLRDAADAWADDGDILLEAAEEIEGSVRAIGISSSLNHKLIDEVDRLRAALKEIGNVTRFGATPQTELARSALQGSE